MRKTFAAFLTASSAFCVSIPENPLLQKYGFTNDALGATAFALLYGEPLLWYEQEFIGATGLAVIGTNNLYVSNGGHLSNSSTNEVIHPNVDTLYAISVLDLSSDDVELYFPPYQQDRVVVIDIWDP